MDKNKAGEFVSNFAGAQNQNLGRFDSVQNHNFLNKFFF